MARQESATTSHRIEPPKVTKPIQLLAAWLVGLIVVNGAFLAAAVQLGSDAWECGALVIAAIINVPLFLIALFVLQTKFRPELQEDVYYSQYLDKKTNTFVTVGRDEAIEKELTVIRAELRSISTDAARRPALPVDSRVDLSLGDHWRIGLNKHLPDFDEIRAMLRARSIRLSEVFGADHAPKKRSVAIAQFLDFQSKLDTLRLACEIRMDAYMYFDPDEEEITEQILFGAYGTAQYPVSSTLRELIDSEPEEADLRLYEIHHKIRPGRQ